jgi:hypothetical protein
MCKTLIAGDIPTDGIGIFKNRIIELNKDMSDSEIVGRIKYGIDNYHKYANDIEYLYSYVSQNFSLEEYPNKLYNLTRRKLDQ